MRLPTLLIDTREKKPLIFPGYSARRATLKIGDYSVHGFKNKVAVEYKSLGDFIIWISERDNGRFEHQLEGLFTLDHSCVVVGGRLGSQTRFSKMPKHKIIEKAAEVSARNIPIVFCQGRKMASEFIVHYLKTVCNSY